MLVKGKHYYTVWFGGDKVKMINQPLLPHKFEIVELASVSEVANAIKTMVVRGAPAIGATGAYGIALAALKGEDLEKAAETLRHTRSTAQDLFHAIDYVLKAEDKIKAADDYANKSIVACKAIGEHGSKLIKDGFRIGTHCNAGWLACVDWGTALAPIYMAKRQKKKIFVYVDETRPRGQGARLTAWELKNEGIPHAVIADNAAGHFMKGEMDMMIVGADRVAKNGDVANKIGTYEKAVVAKENGVPFYVAAPSSTIDMKCETGNDIPIEERGEEEVLFMFGLDDKGEMENVRVAPEGSKARNPAFDVTPAKFITGIITEKGILKPSELAKAFG